MDYLNKYGFNESDIEELNDYLTDIDISELTLYEERICSTIEYLLSKGIKNIKDIMLNRISLFYMDTSTIENEFKKCEMENIISLINEDVNNFELLNL